jgi:catechol 2,3-dioxygenase-like lactoylglutathione lyase family enzyme
MSGVLRLLRVSRTVRDLTGATAFYRDALGFRVTNQVMFGGDAWGELTGVAGVRGSAVTMRLGEQNLELVAFEPRGDPYPPNSDSADLWFQHIAIVVSDIDAAYSRLCAYSFDPISDGSPQRLPPASGSVAACKFRDPEGHPLELIQFPSGSGDAAWQQKDMVFLGIDHSAIDVANIERSVDFYTRVLGFSVASQSINSGPAQKRLDALQEDVVDVVALQPATAGPPHVELLGYRKPTGHPIPPDAKANDVFADRLVLQVDGLTCLVDALRAENVAFVSPGVVALPHSQHAALVRDPTGHLLLLCA